MGTCGDLCLCRDCRVHRSEDAKVSSPALIAATEKRNELRAKQWGHSLREVEAALEVQYHIRKQSELEDTIMLWEIEMAKLKVEESVKTCDRSWLLKKLGL